MSKRPPGGGEAGDAGGMNALHYLLVCWIWKYIVCVWSFPYSASSYGWYPVQYILDSGLLFLLSLIMASGGCSQAFDRRLVNTPLPRRCLLAGTNIILYAPSLSLSSLFSLSGLGWGGVVWCGSCVSETRCSLCAPGRKGRRG